MIRFQNATSGRVGVYTQPIAVDPVLRRRPTMVEILTSEGQSLGSRLVALPRWMYRGFTESNASDMAAAVAFNTLIALVPMFLLVIAISGLFLKNDASVGQASQVIARLVPVEAGPAAFRAALSARDNSGWLSLVSFFGFAWVGTGFVSCLARSMNKIYGVKTSGYINEKQRGFFVLFIFSSLFIISLGTTIITTFFVSRELPSFFSDWILADAQAQLISYSVGFASAILLFFTLYRVIPNAGQRLPDVWPGSLLAAILFVGLTQLFPIYVRLGFGNSYGQVLGFVSLLVFSLLILAHVILFGTYTNVTWQRHRRIKDLQRRIARAEREGKQAELDAIIEELG